MALAVKLLEVSIRRNSPGYAELAQEVKRFKQSNDQMCDDIAATPTKVRLQDVSEFDAGLAAAQGRPLAWCSSDARAQGEGRR